MFDTTTQSTIPNNVDLTQILPGQRDIFTIGASSSKFYSRIH